MKLHRAVNSTFTDFGQGGRGVEEIGLFYLGDDVFQHGAEQAPLDARDFLELLLVGVVQRKLEAVETRHHAS